MATTPKKRILLTGASGYIGGRLLRRLADEGYQVRCLTRRPDELRQRVDERTEVVGGDVLDRASLQNALRDVWASYYFVHSMGTKSDFEKEDREGAKNFGEAAKAAGVQRIVYLGGLGEPDEQLSKHLRSRQETGDVLREAGVQVIEFRASIVIGSGSLSFELIRALVERLPVMICPRWVRVQAQPIAIEDVLDYLLQALELPSGASRIFEIGGPEPVSYGDIMHEYARQRGLRRLMIPVPVLTPRLSSLWLGLVTPIYARVGRKLVDSLRNPTLVRDHSALENFDIRPRSLPEAIERAITNEDREIAETKWSDAFSSSGKSKAWGGVRFGSRIVDSRSVVVPISPASAFRPIERIGGETGWYYGNWLWNVRGFLDLLVGGVGVRRGRRDPNHLRVGDALDFWRVEQIEPNHLLRLQAEMKVPGRAWLEFEVTPDLQSDQMADPANVSNGPLSPTEKEDRTNWRQGDQEPVNACEIRQTAIFDPQGLLGLAYWYALYPLHEFVFAGMLRGIARAAEKEPEK
jgi:uncharacterized protein YbjT (DUF2867 family)